MTLEVLIDKKPLEKVTLSIVNTSTKYISNLLILILNDNFLINVNFINVVAFSRLIKKKNYNLNILNLKNIKKTLNIKLKFDSAIKLLKKFYHLLKIFSHYKIDKLFAHRLYNHKIELIKDKNSSFDFLYDIFKNELLIL